MSETFDSLYHSKGPLMVTRIVTRDECPWLDADLFSGVLVYAFKGPTYGCVSPKGIAVTCTLYTGEPFFEVPLDALSEPVAPLTHEQRMELIG